MSGTDAEALERYVFVLWKTDFCLSSRDLKDAFLCAASVIPGFQTSCFSPSSSSLEKVFLLWN